jgi:hypothetical protein
MSTENTRDKNTLDMYKSTTNVKVPNPSKEFLYSYPRFYI